LNFVKDIDLTQKAIICYNLNFIKFTMHA